MRALIFLLFICYFAQAAAPDRITKPVDSGKTAVVAGNLNRLASVQYDKGPVDPAMGMHYMMLMTKPSAAQQADLDKLLADQQNPSSPQFHKWLTPEEFGNRFGLSPGDHSKIVAWLHSEGFQINQLARGRNWVAFTGNAGQVSKSFHTSIHRYEVNGQSHFANSTEPSIPEALAGVTGGFIGLNDFKPVSNAIPVPDYNSGTNHYLVPQDYGVIYNIAPLYQLGLDGTGVNIAVVGQSDVLLSDLQAFKQRYGLPANNPKMVNYDGIDPGYNGAELEGNLDLEWSSAIAPKATIYYVYGADAFAAMIVSVDAILGQIISSSYGLCEAEAAQSYYRSAAQQANAQGITIVSASGDSGAAACDAQGSYPFAEGGPAVLFPAVMPEVTGVGGTQFVEGMGTYWATANSATFGSALSYIPEAAWNESGTSGLGSTGGGASALYSRPVWQNGPGVPMDNARHVPDVALSAAGHDAYEVNYLGGNGAVAGTSASTPSMAGILALLNQYQVVNGFQAKPGLGNINPQLYRLAQSSPTVFHDVLAGTNVVPCGQGSTGCLTGSYGYQAGSGYDMTTGLGSIDAFDLFGQWNTVTAPVVVGIVPSSAKVTANDTIQLTASVSSARGTGTPTGTVAFSVGTVPLGTTSLVSGMASVTFPAYLVGTGTSLFYAEYSGDAAFSSGGVSTKIQIAAPSGVASIVPSWPNTVWPILPDAEGLSWETTLTLNEVAGVAAMLTGFTIDGMAQNVAQYFPQVNIVPRGSISSTFVLRNQATPLAHTYGFVGLDANGNNWSRQVTVNYNSKIPYYEDIPISATPEVVAQDVTAPPSCQWPVQLHLDNLAGNLDVITNLYTGYTDVSSQIDSIFGTTRVDAFGSVSGTLCFGGITPPATESITVYTALGIVNALNISFVGPPASPAKITASPASLGMAAPNVKQPAQATFAIGLSDKTQSWTASVFPANQTTSWLTVSQLSGTGPVQISLTANGAGFEPGVYRANIVLQCVNAVPQSVTVPVMFVLGASLNGTAVTAIGNAATYQNTAAPGMLLTVAGTNLANATAVPAAGSPLPYSTAGVTATVNGIAAPLVYVSPGQLNLQIPYSAGAGPAVLGINNNGQIAGFQFNIAAAAPGIFTDASGSVGSQTAGGKATLQVTGAGEINPKLKTAYIPSTGSAYQPVLPVSVTVAGVPAFLQSIGPALGVLGTTQVAFTVPAGLTPGNYPVVVTVGGVASPPAMITVKGN